MRILFVSKPHSENFIRNFQPYLPRGSRLLVTRDIKTILREEKNYEVTVLEWANHTNANLINNYPFRSKIIVRIHDHEVRQGRIHNVNWKNVMCAWFINREVMQSFLDHYPTMDHFFLPNAVDPKPFTETLCKEKKIGLLSIYTRPRKRIDRAILLMRELSDWKLIIRTDHSGLEEAQEEWKKLKKLSAGLKNVLWELRNDEFTRNGYPYDDVNRFFQDKAITLCTSSHEGFCYAIAQGMAAGCMPVVYDWEYGNAKDFWLPFVCKSIKEMAAAVRKYEPSKKYREYVVSRFHPKKLYTQLTQELEKRIRVKARHE